MKLKFTLVRIFLILTKCLRYVFNEAQVKMIRPALILWLTIPIIRINNNIEGSEVENRRFSRDEILGI